MSWILKLFLNGAGIFIIGYFLKGVEIKSFFTALGVALLLALVNTFVKPILVFLTLPLTVITFGLFILVINALMLMLVDALVDGMKIKNFGWAFLFGLLLSILNVGFF
ncbi:MAG: phage holin family protein [Balneolaceae bacterium]|jgi:putative membrane protein